MKKVLIYLRDYAFAIGLPIVLFLIMFLAARGRLTMSAIATMLQQAFVPAILAWGMCFELRCGNLDMSLGANVIASAIIGGSISNMLGMGIVGCIIFCPIIGALIGMIAGYLYRLLKVPSIIISLGVLLILESSCALINSNTGVRLPSSEVILGRFPANLIVTIILFAVAFVVFNFFGIGYKIRAVGNSIKIAQTRGINVYKIKFFAFIIGGFFAGCYGFMQLGQSGIMVNMQNMQSISSVFNGMMCVLVAELLGRKVNVIIGVYIGAVCLQILKFTLMLLETASEWNSAIVAIFVLIFMAIANNVGDLRARIARRRKAYVK